MNIPVPPPSAVPAISPALRAEMLFWGRGGEFLHLLIRGSLLQIPTFGFYRFWLITDIRRHLWANTRLGDEAFEYTGTARELLVGFLMALAILAPIYVLYTLVGILAEERQAFASVPLFLALYVFGQYAAFRARRYRATRTTFRGLRFWMAGSAWRYAGLAALWDLATVLTLGLAYPWRCAALERCKMRATRYGDLAGDFVGEGAVFFRRGFLLWLLAAALPLGTGIVALGVWQSRALDMDDLLGLGAGLSFLAVVPLLLVYPLLRATQIRWQVEGIRFGTIRFDSGLKRRTVFGLYAKWIFAGIAYSAVLSIVGLVFAVFLAGSLDGLDESTRAWATAQGLLVIALFYFVFFLGLGVLKRYYLDRGLWAAVALTTVATHVGTLDRVAAAGLPAGSTGEGLADALDVGAF